MGRDVEQGARGCAHLLHRVLPEARVDLRQGKKDKDWNKDRGRLDDKETPKTQNKDKHGFTLKLKCMAHLMHCSLGNEGPWVGATHTALPRPHLPFSQWMKRSPCR